MSWWGTSTVGIGLPKGAGALQSPAPEPSRSQVVPDPTWSAGAAGGPVSVPGQLAASPALSAKGVGAAKVGAQLAAAPAVSAKGTGQAKASGQLAGAGAISAKATAAVGISEHLAAAPAISAKFAGAGGPATVGAVLAASPAISGKGVGQAKASAQVSASPAITAKATGQARADVHLVATPALAARCPLATVPSSKPLHRGGGRPIWPVYQASGEPPDWRPPPVVHVPEPEAIPELVFLRPPSLPVAVAVAGELAARPALSARASVGTGVAPDEDEALVLALLLLEAA